MARHEEDEEEKKEPEVHELRDIQVDAIGLVERGANRAPIIIMKSRKGRDGKVADELMDVGLEAEPVITEAKLENAVAKAFRRVFKARAEKAKLTADEKKQVANALKMLGDLTDKLPKSAISALEELAAEDEEEGYGYPAAKADPAVEARMTEMAKSLEGKDAAIKDLSDKLAAETKARRVGELAEVAKSVTGYTAEELWGTEQKLGADGFQKLTEALKAAKAQESLAAITKEIGVTGSETSETAIQTVTRMAKEKVSKSEAGGYLGAALDEVLAANPDLAERFRAERMLKDK